MTKNLSIFYIADSGPATGTPSPVADTAITQITYRRESWEDTFYPNPSRFNLQSTITAPESGIDTSVPLCVVNRKGANGQGLLDLFVRTGGGRIGWITSNTGGNGWGLWDTTTLMPPNGVGIATGPAVSAYALDSLVLLIRGTDNQLYRRFFSGGSWSGWYTTPSLGAPPSGTIVDVEVIGFPTNDYRVYVRTSTNQLWYRNFDGANFGDWIQVSNVAITSIPEGVDVEFSETVADQVDDQTEGMNIFYRGSSNEMRLLRTTPSGMDLHYSLGGGLTTSSGSVYFRDLLTPPSSNSGSYYQELHTFVRGNDGLLYGKYGQLDVVAQSLTNISNWYSFGFASSGGLGRIFNKPDAVTWDGIPTFP